jgi:3-methyladenine DNA glycosylase AlkD
MTKAREKDSYDALVATLRAFGDPERAGWDKAYHKSRWEHWGVSIPQIVVAVRRAAGALGQDESLELSRRLWRAPVWDLKIASLRLLANKALPPDQRMWALVTQRMGDLDGWAVADNLANVAWRCLIADPNRLDDVEGWVESPHLWTRRAALVFTLPWTKAGRDPERSLAWAVRLKADREWFVQKAIGWWLRELSKRDPERVRRFLADHGAALGGVARREAIKYLGERPRARRGGARARERSHEPA